MLMAIGDKIAASKRKGLWVGGTLPFGYEMKEGKIAIIEEEAELVRSIFRRSYGQKIKSKRKSGNYLIPA